MKAQALSSWRNMSCKLTCPLTLCQPCIFQRQPTHAGHTSTPCHLSKARLCSRSRVLAYGLAAKLFSTLRAKSAVSRCPEKLACCGSSCSAEKWRSTSWTCSWRSTPGQSTLKGSETKGPPRGAQAPCTLRQRSSPLLRRMCSEISHEAAALDTKQRE